MVDWEFFSLTQWLITLKNNERNTIQYLFKFIENLYPKLVFCVSQRFCDTLWLQDCKKLF